MTQELMLTLLNRAATGNEMLAVIDGFGVDLHQSFDVENLQMITPEENKNVPTLETIEF